jgi:superfamily II DNA or RNA helicase
VFINLTNLHARIASAAVDELRWVNQFLTFQDEAAATLSRIKGWESTGAVCLLNRSSMSFPSGLLSTLVEAAKGAGITANVVDLRKAPCAPDQAANLAWLRPYQVEAVEAVVRRTRGILWLPTGGGKTEIAVGLTRVLPCRWLFLVHRASIADQCAERYDLRNREHGLALAPAGRIGDGDWIENERFTVATFATLSRRLEKEKVSGRLGPACVLLEATRGLIVDEAHTLPADSYRKVVAATPNAYYRVGMSATPLARGDKRSYHTIASLGRVIYRLLPETLIEEGVLARPEIAVVPLRQESTRKTWGGVYHELIVYSSKRNRLVAQIAKRARKPALVFVQEIDHGTELIKAFEKESVSAAFVHGVDSLNERTGAVKELLAGKIEVLIASGIFQEGIDIPALASVVNASGGKSTIAVLQKLGRGMRVTATKNSFEVWDVKDEGQKWTARHARERIAAYTAEGYAPIVKQLVGF